MKHHRKCWHNAHTTQIKLPDEGVHHVLVATEELPHPGPVKTPPVLREESSYSCSREVIRVVAPPRFGVAVEGADKGLRLRVAPSTLRPGRGQGAARPGRGRARVADARQDAPGDAHEDLNSDRAQEVLRGCPQERLQRRLQHWLPVSAAVVLREDLTHPARAPQQPAEVPHRVLAHGCVRPRAPQKATKQSRHQREFYPQACVLRGRELGEVAELAGCRPAEDHVAVQALPEGGEAGRPGRRAAAGGARRAAAHPLGERQAAPDQCRALVGEARVVAIRRRATRRQEQRTHRPGRTVRSKRPCSRA
mmetsp:Transcript_111270/g.314983  ORF Transcript_111270/g.314983 Transcript_111270/m.314983 type:complete len:307 (+) Transcript_111270:804-1724(+)